MLNVLITHKIIINRVGGNFGGGRYVCGIDYGDVFMGVYLSPNSSICVH